ncbi:MAG: hypothetical protein K6E81_03410 [Lachnospiraceae bacterium]|nr:hypothetical protein [Lachnospiraceae bacterium]
MRKIHRDQYTETIRLLKQVHRAVESSAMTGDTAQAQGLLVQCQEAAVSLGTMIDEMEGEDTEPVHLLEQYCEAVWQASERLRGADGSDGSAPGQGEESTTEAMGVPAASGVTIETVRDLMGQPDSILTQVQAAIDRFPLRTEVVFLPYNASMWDALDTVWRKADADPDCDAYVIPIPYFDKNPDGSVREGHYEGDRFPKDVPVTDYRTYDLAARHPDKIYIHNAYDQYNHVTTVHPDYYSPKLKECTEELVYIPYYVLNDPDPDNPDVIERLCDMIVLPGVVNADRIIVQSEAMKQVYVKALAKYVPGTTEAYWEAKVSGAGSPKMERVQLLRREDLEIPADWQRIIERPDGSQKKVMFYNTSVVAFLNHNEKMIEKMRRAFAIFYENREEIALLWRPHPLMESTLTAMRPELWEAYRAVRDEYRAAGWGIYDDSADLDRAIVLSDAYYGDPSSVVWLFQKVGKPVMIQNPEV